jgi:hypothetical protein
MKWPPSPHVFGRISARPTLGKRTERFFREQVSRVEKELRAVAIEYARSRPHRLESVEDATIGRTRSARNFTSALTRPRVVVLSGQRKLEKVCPPERLGG